jgi:hypothetical protein
MPIELGLILSISFIGLTLIFALQAYQTREWRSTGLGLVGLALFALLLNRLFGYPFSPAVVAKGPRNDLIIATALYICMLLGMFSQYIYRRFELPRRQRRKWDWGLFLAPVFASPIVFIPLFAAFSNAGIRLENLPGPRFMVFLVAFQNGFFWKEFFDKKQKEGTG